MPFEKGSNIWALRKSDFNQPRKYLPHELPAQFNDYVEWVNNNPITKPFFNTKTGFVDDMKLPRPLTIIAFCQFIGLSRSTFDKWSKEPEYEPICSIIRDAIYNQKYEGAAVGIFNSTIMVRDLNLSEQVNVSLDDERKKTSDLFPPVIDIMAEEVEDTDIEEIKKLNDGTTDQQKP